MASDETSTPWTQPKFLIAAVLVIALVILGVVLALSGRDEPGGTSSTPTTTSSATVSAPVNAGAESVCGLPGYADSGTLASAPEAEWLFQGTTAYPTSSEYGPGATSPEGVRYCFQRTPTGALFAAANAVVQGSDPSTARAWLEYFLAAGPMREELLADSTETSSSSSTRLEIAGFRVMSYDGDSARIDVGARVAGSGNTAYGSIIYELIWEDGDWKLNVTDPESPLNMAQVPDLAGYIDWGA